MLLPDAQEEQGLSGVIVEVDGVAHGSTEAEPRTNLRSVFLSSNIPFVGSGGKIRVE